MKIPPAPHPWSVTPRRAIVIQKRLAGTVRQASPRRAIRLVAGVDLAFWKEEERCVAAAVLWDLDAQEVVESHLATRRLAFPYIPGLLSFREAPAVLAALRKLRRRPHALLCDGHGLAHPRRFGIACHLGVITKLPTIGCAKSRLTGTHGQPGRRRGSVAPLEHRGAVIGSVLRTRDGIRPLFVSVGHRIDLESAVSVVLACATRYRMPEPTRLADCLAAQAKKRSRRKSGT